LFGYHPFSKTKRRWGAARRSHREFDAENGYRDAVPQTLISENANQLAPDKYHAMLFMRGRAAPGKSVLARLKSFKRAETAFL